MTALGLLQQLERRGIRLWAEDGRLRWRGPKGALDADLLAALAAHKAELLSLLGQTELLPIPAVPPADDYPLSAAQQRLWVLAQLETETAAYNVPLHQYLHGPLHREVLVRALHRLVERHEALRTVLVNVAGEPRQRILPAAQVTVGYRDLRGEADPLATARQLAAADARQPFDLAAAAPLRMTLLTLTEQDHALLLTLHHSACDGVSIALIGQELATLYAAFSQGQPDPLPPLRVQYKDFAVWQRDWLTGPDCAAARAYWLEKLGGTLPVLDLPTDYPRPPVQTFNGAELSLLLTREQADALTVLGRRQQCSLFGVLLALLKTLLYRYSGQRDLIVGSPCAGRGHPDLENQIGCYLNMLALRDTLDPTLSFKQWLAQVRQTVTAALDRQHYPFDRLVDDLKLSRDLSRSPLFDVTLILQNQADDGFSLEGLRVQPLFEHPGTSKTDLTFCCKEIAQGLVVSIEYNTDVFSAARIRRMAEHWRVLTAAVLADPDSPLYRLHLLPDSEWQQLYAYGRPAVATSAPAALPADPDRLVSALDAALARWPAQTVSGGGGVLRFADIDALANGLAQRLLAQGVQPDQLIAVAAARTPRLLVALLGILRAGAAYLPLDPDYPADRLDYMLDDAGVALVVTEAALAGQLPLGGRTCVYLDTLAPAVPVPPVPAWAGHLAYTIYTSGSTGKPKGVAISRAALSNFLDSMQQSPGLGTQDTLVALTTLAFDIAGLELWLPLLCGARLVLAERATAQDGERLAALLAAEQATVAQATPATWRALLASGWRGQAGLRVWCGGEALPRELAAALSARCAAVWNLYGPTETTIWSSAGQVQAPTADDRQPLEPLGAALAATTLYLLDGYGQPVPLGVPGALYIGGAGLARAYHARPALTAERFVPDPFATTPGARLYQTGDLARWREDGRLDFLGRADAQVKVRGFRIEPGEIETALRQHPALAQAVVVARDDPPDGQQLVAYLTPATVPPVAELRAWLARTLPEYMIPTVWQPLDALPLTANGKIDRRALPAPQRTISSRSGAVIPPQNALEQTLAAAWADVLGLELAQVGRDADFFALGGHSLKAVRLVHRLHTAGLGVALADVFRYPTPAALAGQLQPQQVAPLAPIPRLADSDPAAGYPASHGQRRLWVLQRLTGAAAVYHIPVALHLAGALDRAALIQALTTLVQRHESLRTTLSTVGAELRQFIQPPAFTLTEQDCSGHSDPAAAAQLWIEQYAAAPFDLAQGPLLRVALLQLAAQQQVLVGVLHHVIGDGASLAVLLKELALLYNAYRRGAADPLPPLPLQYKDFAAWQNARLAGPAAEQDRAYWQQQLQHAATLDLPLDAVRPVTPGFAGATLAADLDSAALRRLAAEVSGSSLFMVLTALVKTLLYRYSGQRDLTVGCPIAGRDHPDLAGQVGFYANTLALRTVLDGTQSFTALLAQVRATLLAAYEHAAYPFDRLVAELGLERDSGRSPLFDVMLALETADSVPPALDGLTVTGFSETAPVAKFDLTFRFTEQAEQVRLELDYDRALFQPERMQALLAHLQQLLAAAVARPDCPLDDLPLLTEADRQRLHRYNPPLLPLPLPVAQTVPEQVAALARQFPARTALIQGENTLSYGQLLSRADSLAQRLRAGGVRVGDTVGVCLERSLAQIVALLAVWRSGAAYLPLDPAYPPERLAYLLNDSRVSVVLTHSALRARLDSRADCWCLDTLPTETDTGADTAPLPSVTPAQLAYVIYTSGSTGQPKGVMIAQQGLLNLVNWHQQAFAITAADRGTALAGLAFDASVWEVWPYLTAGATLLLAEADTLSTPQRLRDWLVAGEATVSFVPTPLAEPLLGLDWPVTTRLRWLLTGGDRLRRYPPAALPFTLSNNYGPTECSVVATSGPIAPAVSASALLPSLGRAISHTSITIRDRHGQQLPPFLAGELCISGVGLAWGYRNRPTLTAERFIPDPDSGLPGARQYRTGDLARWRTDGTLEYLGRIDDQIALRGLRIEPGEIEAALQGCTGVAAAAVAVQSGPGGGSVLVGYLVLTPDSPAAMQRNPGPLLRAELAHNLPESLIPSLWRVLAALPLTANGKLDRRALPPPDWQDTGGRQAADALERVLAGLYQELLGRPLSSVEDSFFALGGHSLLAIQILGRLREVFRVEIALTTFFPASSVAELAVTLRSATPQADRIAAIVERLAAMSDEEKERLRQRHTLPE